MLKRKPPPKIDRDKTLNRRNLIVALIVGIIGILTFLIELPQKISATIDIFRATDTLTPSLSSSSTPITIPTLTPIPCSSFTADTMDNTVGWMPYTAPDGSGSFVDPRSPFASVPGQNGNAIKLSFNIQLNGWVGMYKPISSGMLTGTHVIQFSYKGNTRKTIEFKLFMSEPAGDVLCDAYVDSSGGIGVWKTESIPYSSFNCSGKKSLDPSEIIRIDFAISKRVFGELGSGELTIDDVRACY